MPRNLLLGHGENLVSNLLPPKHGGSDKDHPYKSRDEVYDRLRPEMERTLGYISNLASEYCPFDKSVFRLALHPQYLAKSYFPVEILRAFALEVIGSKFVTVNPARRGARIPDGEIRTVELYVAGERKNIDMLNNRFTDERLFDCIRRIERIRAFEPGERILGVNDCSEGEVFELVLHSGSSYDDSIVHAFSVLAKRHNIEAMTKKRIQTTGLSFIPIAARDWEGLSQVEPFSYLRLIRKMPRLRDISREGAGTAVPFLMAQLPRCTEVKSDVAVFDLGCDVHPSLNGWVHKFPLAREFPDVFKHGSRVNSALLFGAVEPGRVLSPVASIDCYQVVDPADTTSGLELYEAIDRIGQILDTHDYKFVNLSIGPDLPIADDDVHAWTAKLDEKLASGTTLMTVAVGNNGDRDEASGNARVEVPGDSVNALSVGASTDVGEANNWERASYSAIGPGRTPGRIKPDVLDFGGSDEKGFGVVDPVHGMLHYRTGTSYAAPNALRKCIALQRRYPELGALALKALLVHNAIRNASDHCDKYHGHGALPEELDRYVVCGEGEISVVYQGHLEPKKYVKAPIPIPKDGLSGKVTIKATLCYATNVDPNAPGSYTRSAIEVTLRPNMEKFRDKKSTRPISMPFFDHGRYESEMALRNFGLKWDTVMSGEKNLLADKSIREPFFELHYIPREGMNPYYVVNRMPYALVVTVRAPKAADIYAKVCARYMGKIRPISEVGVPIPVGRIKVV